MNVQDAVKLAGPCFAFSATTAPGATTPVNVQTGGATAPQGAAGDVVLEVFNSGTNFAFVAIGANAAAATAAAAALPTTGTQGAYPIPAGAVRRIVCPANSFLCAVANTGAVTLYCTPLQNQAS